MRSDSEKDSGVLQPRDDTLGFVGLDFLERSFTVNSHSKQCGEIDFMDRDAFDSPWSLEISADPIRHTEEGGDIVRQIRPTEEDVGIEINTFEWLLGHRMIFADKAHIRIKFRLSGFVPKNALHDGHSRANRLR